MSLCLKNGSRDLFLSVCNRSSVSCVLAVVVMLLMSVRQSVSASEESGAETGGLESVSSENDSAGPVTDILVVLDTTASMEYATGSAHGASRLDLARIVTSSVLDVAPTGINLGVLTLRDDVSELRPLEPLASADRTQIRRGVETLNPFGDGDLVTCFQRIADRLDPASSPLVVMVTDGASFNSQAANLAAGKLHDAFAGRLRFVLIGICKQGAVADQLQALAAFAGGDSISLTSENDIPTGLASVREACDEVRRHRLSLLKRLEENYLSALTEIATLRDEVKVCRNSNGKLAAELQSARNVEQALRAKIDGKEIQIAAQSGQIAELKQQSGTLGKDLATAQVALGEQTQLRIKSQELVTQSQKELRALQKSSKVEREALEELRTKTLISDEDAAELKVFRESWIAPFAEWDGTLGGLLGLLVLGGSGTSLFTSRLLGGKLTAGNDAVAAGVSQTLGSLKETESAIETRIAELTNQQFEKTIQKVEETKALQDGVNSRLDEISQANAGQLSVSETASASVVSLKELLTGTEQKILAGQTTVVERVEQARSEQQRDTSELKSTVESQHAAQLSGLREGTASINWQLQEAAKLAVDRFEATRGMIEAGRSDIGDLRDALRQEVNDSSEETIRRIAEKSDSQLTPLKQLVQETRDDLERQADQTQTFAHEVRDSASRIGEQIGQLPMRLETAGSQISTAVTQEMRQQLTSVQITIQSVRDQIDQVKHQLEAGLHESERRQIESSGRTEQLGNELARLASLSDQIVLSIQSETATVTSEVKDATHGLSGTLTRVESQLQSVIREFDQLRNARPESPTMIAEVKLQLEQLQDAIKTLTAESRSRLSETVAVESDLESKSDSDAERTDTTVSGDSDPAETPRRQSDPVDQKKTPQDEASRSGARRQEIRELSMLPNLGEKSAEVLVAEGVNSIHELADLADDRKGVIEHRGGQFRRLDEWVAVARKVRTLHEKYDVPLKAAAGYAQSETWPEKLRHLPPEELQRLSSEFRGFAIWLNESTDLEADIPKEPDDVKL